MPSPMATTVSTWASVPALLHDLRDHGRPRINKPAETLMLVDTHAAAARTSAGELLHEPAQLPGERAEGLPLVAAGVPRVDERLAAPDAAAFERHQHPLVRRHVKWMTVPGTITADDTLWSGK